MDSELIAIMAEIASCNAEIAAMQVENTARVENGLAEAYGEDEFWSRAEHLKSLAESARSVSVD